MATRRIVVTGPECTGKTTLAAALAARLGAPWVPEAARQFAESHAEPLSAATVEPIARLTMRLHDAALAPEPPVAVFDTDLASTVVYARHYYGACPAWIAQEARRRRAELYLLCATDLPWVADGVRDRPGQREALFEDFAGELARMGARVAIVRGRDDARLAQALQAVQAGSGDAVARGA